MKRSKLLTIPRAAARKLIATLSKGLGRGKRLLVVVMAVGRKHVDINLSLKDTIYQAMLLRQFTAPAPFGLTLQRFGMPQPRL